VSPVAWPAADHSFRPAVVSSGCLATLLIRRVLPFRDLWRTLQRYLGVGARPLPPAAHLPAALRAPTVLPAASPTARSGSTPRAASSGLHLKAHMRTAACPPPGNSPVSGRTTSVRLYE